MSAPSQRRALIIGGSMSGLLAALMLRRRGWEADIYERVAGELAGRGAGIVAQPSLIAHLKALGLDTSELGVPIARRQMLDREGARDADGPTARKSSPPGSASTGCCAMPFRLRTTTAAASSHRSSKRRAASLPAFPTAASAEGDVLIGARRAAFDRAAALSARDRAALRRLCRLARDVDRRTRCRRRSTMISSMR